MKKRFLLLSFLLLWNVISSTAGNTIDSLQSIIQTSKTDTLKINAFLALGNEYKKAGDIQNAINNGKQALQIAQALPPSPDKNRFLAISHYNLGLILENGVNHKQSVEYFLKAIELAEKAQLWDLGCGYMGHLALYYYSQSDYPTALDYSFRQLKLAEKINNKNKMASACNKIGIVYKRQMLHADAIKYLQRSISLYTETKDDKNIANTTNNLGDVYFNEKKYKAAYGCYNQELVIGTKIKDKELVADAYNSIAKILYTATNESNDSLPFIVNTPGQKPSKTVLLDSAIVYLQRALAYYQGENLVYEMTDCLNGIGLTLSLQEKNKDAIQTFQNSYELAKGSGLLEKQKTAAFGLFEIYKKTENDKQSLQWFQTYSVIKDSMFNDSKARDLGRLESQQDYEVKEAVFVAKQQQERALAAAEKKRQQTIIWLVSGGLAIVFVLFVFLFSRFKIIQKQKKTIEFQKQIVEEKNIEITGSIVYAKRIQNAILPKMQVVKHFFPESFILLKPKDIVAGDFYWMESIPEVNKVFFSAADCTGHGVPGAMVSVMCSSALSKSVKELEIYEPAKILDKTVEILEERFSNSEEDVQDGMDIALCAIDLKTRKLEYAGANNPLWIIRKNDQNGFELIEVAPNKQPVGKFTLRKPFTNHSITLEPNSSIYIFTDGFADQFGGPKGKKFKVKALKELLLSVQELDMEAQKKKINEVFESWRGNLEQVDDVCLIGIKL